MAGATLTNKDAILQDNFGEGVSFLVNVRTNILNRFPISPKRFDGRQIRENIGTGMPAGGGGAGPGLGAVPAASTSSNAETYIFHGYFYDTISIDWDVMEQSSGRHAYIDAITQEVKRVAQYRQVDFERMLAGDSSSRLAHGVVVASITATSPLTITISGTHNAVFFPKGQRILFMDAATFETAAAKEVPAQGFYEVSSVSRDNSTSPGVVTITFDSDSVGSAGTEPEVGDVMVKYLSVGFAAATSSNNAGNELVGLDDIIDDDNHLIVTNTKAGFPSNSTFQGIDSTGEDTWQAAVVDAQQSYLGLDVVEDASDELGIHGGMSSNEVKFILAHHNQIRKHLLSLTNQERYPNTGNAGSFASGAQTTFDDEFGPDVGMKPTVKSRFCRRDAAYLVGPGILHYDLKQWGFADKDGSMWEKDSNGRPAYVAKAYCYKQVGTTKRNCSARIENLKTTGL